MIKFSFYSRILCFVLITTAYASSGFQDREFKSQAKKQSKSVTYGGFLTLAHWRNDTDFDASERYDDLDGQTKAKWHHSWHRM